MNNIDIYIFLLSAIGFVTFFLSQAILSTISPFVRSMYEMLRILIWSWIIAMLAVAGTSLFVIGYPWYSFPLAVIISSLTIVAYILCVFSIVYFSVHLQILDAIIAKGEKGISEVALKKEFGTKTLIAKRVERLLLTGELILEKNMYEIKNETSVLLLRERVSQLLTTLFP